MFIYSFLTMHPSIMKNVQHYDPKKQVIPNDKHT